MSASDAMPNSGKPDPEQPTSGKGKKRIDISVAFALCGALLFLLIFLYMFKQERDVAIQSFQVQVEQDVALFEQKLTHNLYSLDLIQAYLHLSGNVNEADFEKAASRIVNRSLAVVELVWLPEGQDSAISFSKAKETILSEDADSLAVSMLNSDSVTSNVIFHKEKPYLVASSVNGQGQLAVLIDLQAVIQASLLNSLNEDVAIHLFASSMEANAPVFSIDQGVVAEDSITDKKIDLLNGIELTLSFAATESYLADKMNYTSVLFLLTGLLLSFLLASYLKRIGQHLNRLKDEQEILSEQMIDTSWHDPLTGLVNRIHFDEALDVECRRAVREFMPLSMILLRIDDLSAYRDHYGVDAANILVQRISETLKNCVSRPGDMLALVDVNLFGFILPSTNELVVQLAERCCLAVRELHIPNESMTDESNVTVSLGVVTLQPSRLLTAEHLLNVTQEQLDEALADGGNQYKAYTESCSEPSLTYSV